jgi:TIR domain
MAYVPGYRHDLFISYAHGDDRDWINRLVDRLEPALSQRLGINPSIWIDDHKLRQSRDFSKEIPDSVKDSAVFLLLPSPTHIRSRYCIDQECKVFAETIADKRVRFSGEGFANELFALRCPILPIDRNEHWTLFPGLTDIPFCDESDTFAVAGSEFETSFRRLVGELVGVLKRMRNHSTAVFVYPSNPGPHLQDVYQALTAELSAHSYRILPDRTVNLTDQLREASLSVFLLGPDYDETAGELVEVTAGQKDKPWVAWCSPTVEQKAAAEQIGFCTYVEQLDSASKTYLHPGIMPAKLKEEVLGLLRPDPRALTPTEGKPRVYLVYNSRDRAEVKNADLISFHFRKDVHFEHPDDPAQHTLRLSRSDGVLLVWGNADENWCSREFAEMVQSSRRTGAHGLCLFDPKETKTAALQEIRRGFVDLYIGEQFGKFDPTRLATFFTSILRRSPGARS